MGALRQRGKIWYVDVCRNGKRIRKRVGPSKKIAQDALHDIESQLAKGEFGFEKKDALLDKLFKEYSRYSKTNHSPSTQKRYRAIIDNFNRFLSSHPYIAKISHLGPKFFEDYKAFRSEEEAQNKTINMEVITLRGIFNLAKGWGYIKENPTDGVKILKVTNHIAPRFLSEKECRKLLNACADWERPIFFAFLNTGIRKGELLNLTWDDVDLTRRKIKIIEKEGWVPKTSERQIPINDGLFAVLKALQAKKKGKWVFHDGDGQQIENNRLRKRLMSLTEKCGFPEVTKLHTLRHTFASHLVMKGIDLPTVKKLMGHSSIDTTMIYSHLADDHVDKAVEKLEF